MSVDVSSFTVCAFGVSPVTFLSLVSVDLSTCLFVSALLTAEKEGE